MQKTNENDPNNSDLFIISEGLTRENPNDRISKNLIEVIKEFGDSNKFKENFKRFSEELSEKM